MIFFDLPKCRSMRLPPPKWSPNQREILQKDLLHLLDQPSPQEKRPCPECRIACAKHGSAHCTCACNASCPNAPHYLTSDSQFPIENGVLPLVLGLVQLRVVQTCWSCQGHDDASRRTYKLPQVWFYSPSAAYPQLVAACLAKLHWAKKLSRRWRVTVEGPSGDFHPLYIVKPVLDGYPLPKLEDLQNDIQAMSAPFFDLVRQEARAWLARLGKPHSNFKGPNLSPR